MKGARKKGNNGSSQFFPNPTSKSKWTVIFYRDMSCKAKTISSNLNGDSQFIKISSLSRLDLFKVKNSHFYNSFH